MSDASVDVVISNGVINLAPDKPRVFREIARVLRPRGRLYLADVVVRREFSLAVRENSELWAACIGGALPEQELHEIVAAYIETGEPVASRSIARRRGDTLSAASVRNVMADLDEEGYLH